MFDIGTALTIGGALLGGMGGSGGSSRTQTQELDPRLAKYVYGGGGDTGLLQSAFDIYKKQMAQGGLNELQRQGLGMQQQFLSSPQFTQGYDAMRQMGMGLLSAAPASNPFTGGTKPGLTTNPMASASYTPTVTNVSSPSLTTPDSQTIDSGENMQPFADMFPKDSPYRKAWKGGIPDRDTVMKYYNAVENLYGGGGDSGPNPNAPNAWEATQQYFQLPYQQLKDMTGWSFVGRDSIDPNYMVALPTSKKSSR